MVKIKVMRLLFVFVFLLGLVSCGEEKSSSSSGSDSASNNKSTWTKSQKKECLDEYIDSYQDLSDLEFLPFEILYDVYNTSFEESASCFCDLAEKKHPNYNDFYDLNDYEYWKIEDESLVLLTKDNSKINNWSFKMKKLCNKSFLSFGKKVYSRNFKKNEVNCFCEVLENEYSSYIDYCMAAQDGYITEKELTEIVRDNCSF